MKIEFNEYAMGAGIIGGVAGLVGLGFGLYSANKMKGVAKVVGVSVERLKEMTEVEVSDSLVKTAVNNKVDKVVTEMVSEASRTAVDAIKADMHATIRSEVDKAVSASSEKILEGVEERIEEQVRLGINVNDLSRRIEKRCEDKVMSQMSGILDRVTKMANDELSAKLSTYNDIGKIVKNVLGN